MVVANKSNLMKNKAEIMKAFKIDEKQFQTLLALVKPSCFDVYHTKGFHPSHAVYAWLKDINKNVGGFGVENLSPDFDCQYVNMRDTYNLTIMYYDGKMRIGCTADLLEKNL